MTQSNPLRVASGVRLLFITFWAHRVAASFSFHSACLCTVVLISNLLSK